MSNMQPEYQESCGFCEFFEAAPYDGTGDCRKNPPVIVNALVNRDEDETHQELAFATRFPIVSSHENWCGEFRVRVIRNRKA